MGISVRLVWLSIRSCELQTLAPRLPPFTDTPHPPSLICWASHELAGVGMIGRCVTAQPACAYLPSCPGRYAECPAAGTAWECAGWRAMRCLLSCLDSLHQESRFTRSQIIFFWAPSPLLQDRQLFVLLLFPHASSNPQNTSVHSFPTRCRWYHFATAIRALRTILLLPSARSGSHALPRPAVT